MTNQRQIVPLNESVTKQTDEFNAIRFKLIKPIKAQHIFLMIRWVESLESFMHQSSLDLEVREINTAQSVLDRDLQIIQWMFTNGPDFPSCTCTF